MISCQKEATSGSQPSPEDQPPDDPGETTGPGHTGKKYPLPHWAVYVAYALAFVGCFLSCFFCVLYSLEWGKEKAEEWLISMITSFFSSAFLIQPIKVIILV